MPHREEPILLATGCTRRRHSDPQKPWIPQTARNQRLPPALRCDDSPDFTSALLKYPPSPGLHAAGANFKVSVDMGLKLQPPAREQPQLLTIVLDS